MPPKTFAGIYKRILEQKLSERQIAWVRKMGGLQLAIFGNPIVHVTDESISIELISGAAGSYNRRAYHKLEFSHGDVRNPNCDPEATIEKILSIADTFKALMMSATNTDQIARMGRINLPGNTAKSVTIRACRDRGFPKAVAICDGSAVKIWLDGIKNTIAAEVSDEYNKGDKIFKQWDFSMANFYKDGTGTILVGAGMSQGIIFDGIKPLDEILDNIIESLG